MPLEAVIFDMDGVLVDSEPIHCEATRRLLARYGVHDADPEDPALVGLTDLEVFAMFAARYNLPVDAAHLSREFVPIAAELIRSEATPMPGVPDALHALRDAGYRLALASSSSLEVIAITLETLGVQTLFEQIVSSVEVGRGKPAPDVFVETARRLGVAPEACFVIEDSRNGVLAARAAGMPCAAVPCPSTRQHDLTGATFIADTLSAVVARILVDTRESAVPKVLTAPATPDALTS